MSYNVYCAHHSPIKSRKEYLEKKRIEYNFDFEYIESFLPGTADFVNRTPITDGELSVTLKYLEAMKKSIDSNVDYCFIFEDDILIEFDLNVFFEKIISESVGVDLVFWGGVYTHRVENPVDNKIVYDGYYFSRCGHGIMFTNETCKKIINNYDYNFERPFDITMNYLIPHLNLNCAWTHPYVKQKTAEGLERSSLR